MFDALVQPGPVPHIFSEKVVLLSFDSQVIISALTHGPALSYCPSLSLCVCVCVCVCVCHSAFSPARHLFLQGCSLKGELSLFFKLNVCQNKCQFEILLFTEEIKACMFQCAWKRLSLVKWLSFESLGTLPVSLGNRFNTHTHMTSSEFSWSQLSTVTTFPRSQDFLYICFSFVQCIVFFFFISYTHFSSFKSMETHWSQSMRTLWF